jgi:hypothetical protein
VVVYFVPVYPAPHDTGVSFVVDGEQVTGGGDVQLSPTVFHGPHAPLTGVVHTYCRCCEIWPLIPLGHDTVLLSYVVWQYVIGPLDGLVVVELPLVDVEDEVYCDPEREIARREHELSEQEPVCESTACAKALCVHSTMTIAARKRLKPGIYVLEVVIGSSQRGVNSEQQHQKNYITQDFRLPFKEIIRTNLTPHLKKYGKSTSADKNARGLIWRPLSTNASLQAVKTHQTLGARSRAGQRKPMNFPELLEFMEQFRRRGSAPG